MKTHPIMVVVVSASTSCIVGGALLAIGATVGEDLASTVGLILIFTGVGIATMPLMLAILYFVWLRFKPTTHKGD